MGTIGLTELQMGSRIVGSNFYLIFLYFTTIKTLMAESFEWGLTLVVQVHIKYIF